MKQASGAQAATASVIVRAARWRDVPVKEQYFSCDPAVALQLHAGDVVQLALDLTEQTFSGTTSLRARVIAAKPIDAKAA